MKNNKSKNRFIPKEKCWPDLKQNLNYSKTIDIIITEEGFSDVPYLCSAGYVTIGYGTKLHKRKGMNPKNFCLVVDHLVAESLLENEVTDVDMELSIGKYGYVYKSLPRDVRSIVVSMAYQLGYHGLMKFKNTWKYLQIHDFTGAAKEMLDSKWAREDSPNRAKRHSEIIYAASFKVSGLRKVFS